MTDRDIIVAAVSIDATHQGTARKWGQDQDAWDVTLDYGGRTMSLPFYMGTGHGGAEPTVGEVLSCLFSDASTYDECGDDPDEWVAMLGEPESIKALLTTIEQVRRQTGLLRAVFGDDYDDAAAIEWDGVGR